MRQQICAAIALSCLFAGAAISADTVKPGTGPTEAMTEATPTMTGECVKAGAVDTKAPGTEATEATGKLVPAMKPDKDGKCPEGTTLNQPTTK